MMFFYFEEEEAFQFKNIAHVTQVFDISILWHRRYLRSTTSYKADTYLEDRGWWITKISTYEKTQRGEDN